MDDNQATQPNARVIFNPFAKPGDPPLLQPTLSMPEALQAAYYSARGEWCEFLPHGQSQATCDANQPDWLFELAVDDASTLLKPLLPAVHVTAVATGLALAAYYDACRYLANCEPD